MERTLPAPRVWSWKPVAWTVWLSVNAVMIAGAIPTLMLDRGEPADWITWERAAANLSGDLYGDGVFVWSPLMAYALAFVILPLGGPLLMAAHVAVLAFLRERWVILLALTSYPFWVDTLAGNLFVFVAVAGVGAVRGSRPAALIYLALCLLMPRPVQLPLALWLLWRDRNLILPLAGMTAVSAALVLWTGQGAAWIGAMLDLAGGWPFANWDLGPTRIFGTAWLIVGVPLGAVLLWRGLPGLGGLAVTTYLAPQYLLLALVDRERLVSQHHSQHVDEGVHRRDDLRVSGIP